jgi:nucleoside-diphosphate-sugar epimerase
MAQACCGPVDLVVHALNPIYTRWEAELLPLARQGMAVAEALGATFLLPGNVYQYGAGMPARLDEDTPAAPTTRKGELRLALEQELADRARQGRLRSLVLRAGDFYGGSGRGSWLDLVIVQSIAQGKLVYPGPLDRCHAWAYLPDLAEAAVLLAERQLAEPVDHQRLHFAGHAVDGAGFLAALEAAAAELGLSPARGWRHGRLPWPLLRAGGLVVPMWRELARMAYLWERPHALAGDALAARIGPGPTTPLVAALAASLRALGHATAASTPQIHRPSAPAAAR